MLNIYEENGRADGYSDKSLINLSKIRNEFIIDSWKAVSSLPAFRQKLRINSSPCVLYAYSILAPFDDRSNQIMKTMFM